ncbi:MAG: hypothetical protein GF308_18550 [Candidatus Heimdallarchaeota archaeon]|nr:hypothetical protein [Candidatus Heimdallarchaeota archaeon]
MPKIFTLELAKIQPSQLYINSEKLASVMAEIDHSDPKLEEPLPIKKLSGKIIFTDGHTRAFALHKLGVEKAPVFWDEDDLDWEAYKICVEWCEQEGIYTIADLENRVVNTKDYERLWYARCDKLHQQLALKRKERKT